MPSIKWIKRQIPEASTWECRTRSAVCIEVQTVYDHIISRSILDHFASVPTTEAMNAKHLLRFMKKKLKRFSEDIIDALPLHLCHVAHVALWKWTSKSWDFSSTDFQILQSQRAAASSLRKKMAANGRFRKPSTRPGMRCSKSTANCSENLQPSNQGNGLAYLQRSNWECLKMGSTSPKQPFNENDYDDDDDDDEPW